MISIEINTKNGNLIKLSTEEAEEIYLALKNLFDKSGKEYPLMPTFPAHPVYPHHPLVTWKYWNGTDSAGKDVCGGLLEKVSGVSYLPGGSFL